MTAPEFSRTVDVGQADGKRLRLEAKAAEREALAKRFGLVRIDRLAADLDLSRAANAVTVAGTLNADIVQSCAVSAEDLPVAVREDIAFRFVPEATHRPDDEIELDAADCDEIEYAGTSIDLGEAVAQSLALAIDPFAVGPEAEQARAGLVGDNDDGPFAALKGLIKE